MAIWVNGVLGDDVEVPLVRVDDHGFLVGDGVFETLKVVQGRCFALTRHLQRLHRSATGLGLPPLDPEYIRTGIDEVLRDAPDGIGRLRITASSGPGPMGSARGGGGPTIVIAHQPAPNWPATTAVAVSPWPRNERSPLVGLKTTSYAENVCALEHAHRLGADEAVMANLAGDLCEGTGSNVFAVIGGELVTPTLDAGCLAGITRALVVEWCGAVERDVPLAALADAEEVFITSSTRDVHPVDRILDPEGRCGGSRALAVGPRTLLAQRTFAARAAADLDPA